MLRYVGNIKQKRKENKNKKTIFTKIKDKLFYLK